MVDHSLYAIIFQKILVEKLSFKLLYFQDAIESNTGQGVHFHHNLVSVSAFYLAASGAQTEIGGFGKFRECLAIASLGASVQPLS